MTNDFSEFFLTSPFVMWQVLLRIWEPYYVSDPLIANFVSFKEIIAAENGLLLVQIIQVLVTSWNAGGLILLLLRRRNTILL